MTSSATDSRTRDLVDRPGPSADSRMRDLVDRHGPPLTRFVRSLTVNQRDSAEDLVQETMVRAWRSLDRFPLDDEGGRRWLFTVARRLVIDGVRRTNARPAEVSALDVDGGVTGDETAAAAVARHSLLEAAARLSPAHRQVLREVYFEDRPVPEVAARLGVPVGTVNSRLHYAIRALRTAVLG